jgi:uncharacterized coiled-coil protein SlyX
MLKGIINFFKGSDDELEAIDARLDALEKASGERIAAKEAYLAKLTKNVQQKQQEVNQLKEVVKRYENAVNRMNN